MALAAATIYFIGPVIWLLIASTKSMGELYSISGRFLPGSHFLENTHMLFVYQGGIYLRWIVNSMLYSVSGAALAASIGTMCGYGLFLYRFPGRRIVLGCVTIGFMVPAAALSGPLYLQLVHMGLYDNVLGILLPSIPYPFGVMFSYLTARSSVPIEIIEAARIDGASEFRIFSQIAIPMMRGGLATVFLFAFMGNWNNYLLPLMVFDDSRLYPLAVGLVDWSRQASSVPQLGTLALVGSFITLTPLLLAFIIVQRYWRPGFFAGAIIM